MACQARKSGHQQGSGTHDQRGGSSSKLREYIQGSREEDWIHNAKPMQNRLIKLVVKIGVSTCFKANSIRDRVLKTHKAMLNLSALCLLPIHCISFTENRLTQAKDPTMTV